MNVKTALFMIMSDTDSTFNFLMAMLEAQLFNILCDIAGQKHGGRLPIHVRYTMENRVGGQQSINGCFTYSIPFISL